MNTSIITQTFSKACFQVKKHSPEILMVTGAVGVVASAVMACKATTKVSEILEDTETKVEQVHTALEAESEDVYSVEDSKKDLAIIYVQSGVKFAKLYGPSIALGALSLSCMISSNGILRKRNIALAAAYTAIDKGFKEYRGRVVERFGEVVDRELKYNIKQKKVTETEIDEKTGKEKKVTKTINVAESVSEYARFFEEYTSDGKGNTFKNPCWEETPEYNLMFLKAQQEAANMKLRAQGYLFLNDVYDQLALPRTKAGQIVGWVYDKKNPVGDNYVDFGLYTNGSQNFSDFVYGTDDGILLDFNVDGNIWDLM